jgi:hypothetical protein
MKVAVLKENKSMTRAGLGMVTVLLPVLLLIIACAGSPEPAPSAPPVPPAAPAPPEVTQPPKPATISEPAPGRPAGTGSGEPPLSDNLKRNGRITQGDGGFDNTGLAIGETAVNFTLKDIHGADFRLSHLLAEKPVVLVFGSFT